MCLIFLLKTLSRALNPQIGVEVGQGVGVKGAEVGVLVRHLKDRLIKSPHLIPNNIQIEARAFLTLGSRNLHCKNEGHSILHLTSLYVFYAAALTSRGYAKFILMLKYKKFLVPNANITMNLVFANPTPEETPPLGLALATTSLAPPQKFSRAGKALSGQYKYPV